LFNERGYAGTTTTEVARAAGIGTGTLFLYVPSKEHLLVAVFREEVGQAWDRAFSAVDITLPLLDQLCTAFVAVIEYHEQDPGLAYAFIRELALVSEPAREGARDFMRDYMIRLEEFLVAAQRREQLRTDVNVNSLATSLYALYHFHIQRRVAGRSDLDTCRADLATAFDLQLRGLVSLGASNDSG
jgi:AcrR family transcriptional regulator